MRPDLVHLYLEGHLGEPLVKVLVDTDYPDAWKVGVGKIVVEYLLMRGSHVLIAVGNQLTFLCAYDKPAPDKLVIDWVL